MRNKNQKEKFREIVCLLVRKIKQQPSTTRSFISKNGTARMDSKKNEMMKYRCFKYQVLSNHIHESYNFLGIYF